MANRMTPPAEGQEKDVLLVLDKQQGKVSAVKGIDKEGNLQTVPPTTGHGGCPRLPLRPAPLRKP